MVELWMAGVDFVHAPLDMRERVSFVRGQVQALLPRIAGAPGVLACVLLATCNRTELYVHGAPDAEIDALGLLARAAGFDADTYRPLSVTRGGEQAVRHLMAVSAGLQSQIFGDEQIVTQVRDALCLARAAGTTDAVLDTLFRRAVTAGKRVRAETRLVGVPSSAAAVAARRAEAFFGSLEGRRAAVIGNGEMGRLAAAALRARGAAVTVTLRTYRHGETVVPAGCATWLYEKRYGLLDGADLAVSATTSPHCTVTAAGVSALLRPPALLIDLAMPRDIEQAVADDGRVTVWNLDDLGDLGEPGADERAAALRILDEEQAAFAAWYAYRQSLPVIGQLKDMALDRLRFDHAYGGLYEDGDLDGMAALAVNKTVDLLLGGMKEVVSPARLAACLEHIKRGSGK
ncbi:MAG: glutamyl-tRNA reductase [Agathobaculum sp.]|uniref:glutamyl-tRNA reductase n=1 Tax=Agathobaculum sp. TaxID=2048138 RepID=UPI002A831E30|nr:glutamyl-tRNA reductase [Agathobaculum sp.]MDY3710854.1 glutamyl-tRNA reductase [Agathobaculum sp.]